LGPRPSDSEIAAMSVGFGGGRGAVRLPQGLQGEARWQVIQDAGRATGRQS
jgi:hypothetical protein